MTSSNMQEAKKKVLRKIFNRIRFGATEIEDFITVDEAIEIIMCMAMFDGYSDLAISQAEARGYERGKTEHKTADVYFERIKKEAEARGRLAGLEEGIKAIEEADPLEAPSHAWEDGPDDLLAEDVQKYLVEIARSRQRGSK